MSNQPDDATVKALVNNCKLTEIFVQSYEDPTLEVGALRDFIIARIFAPVSSPNDIMSGGLKSF